VQSFKEIVLGVTILQGGRISHFPIHFRMGLTTVQRDCAACEKRFWLGIALNPARRAYSAPSDPLTRFDESLCVEEMEREGREKDGKGEKAKNEKKDKHPRNNLVTALTNQF